MTLSAAFPHGIKGGAVFKLLSAAEDRTILASVQKNWIAGAAMLFSWDPEYSLDIAQVDNEHFKLIQMMKKLEMADTRRDRVKIVKSVIGEIEEYCNIHFGNEEDLMRRAGYPHLDAHHQAHVQFKKKVLDLKLFAAFNAAEIHQILLEWLVEHILKTDRDYVPYVQKFLAEHPEHVATAP
jgi:hemerythrin-like metal-binding protein